MGKDIALSVRQPWAWLLVNGYKDVENRNWPTKYRGKCLIHASKTFDHDGYEWVSENFGSQIDDLPAPGKYKLGGIIGEVEIHDCVTESKSPWFFGKYGFVVKNAIKLPFRPLSGRTRFFEVARLDEEAIPEDKIRVRLKVKPSRLAKVNQKARVTIGVENLDGDPLEGVELSGEIVPDTIGSVSKLQPTDADGHSYGEWVAGNGIGEGYLKINVYGTEEKAKVKIRLKPDISVLVDNPVLVACSGASANIVVTVEDQYGRPVQGIKLSGWTLPSTLGRVSYLPDSDADGFSEGTWTAGKKPGKGYLIVRGGGAQGQAVIELKPSDKGCDDGDNGDDDGDDNGDNGDNGNGEEGNGDGGGNGDNGNGNGGSGNGDDGDNGSDGNGDGGNGNGDGSGNGGNGNGNGGNGGNGSSGGGEGGGQTGKGGVGRPSSKGESSRLKRKYKSIKKDRKPGNKYFGSGG